MKHDLVDLAGETIVARLDAADPLVVDDLYDFAVKQLASEDAVSTRIDSRAASLFGAVGFAMTLAFTFGGWSLLDNARKIPEGRTLAWSFGIVLGVGLFASIFAVWSVLLISRGVQMVDEEEVFHEAMLSKEADNGRTDWRIHATAHIWQVWQERVKQNEWRALLVGIGQGFFFVFLLGIFGLAVATARAAVRRPMDPQPIAPPAIVVMPAVPSVIVVPQSPPTALPSSTALPPSSAVIGK